MKQNEVKKILVVVLDNLGDAVMGTSILRPIRDRHPGATVGLWVKKYSSGVFEDQTLVERVHACDPFWDTSPGAPKGSKEEFWKVFRQIRAERYDMAFVLNAEWRRGMACWLAGIPIRIGFRRRKAGFFLTVAVRPPKQKTHFIQEHRMLVEEWAEQRMGAGEFIPRLEVSSSERSWGDRWLADQGWRQEPLAVFHSYAGSTGKCWPMEKWKDLSSLLSKKIAGLRVVWIASGAEEAALRAGLAGLPEARAMVLAGATLSQVKGVLSRARFFIGGDSGPGHVAAAIGIPVLSLFGETDPSRCRAFGMAPVKIIRRVPLEDLSVYEVETEAMGLHAHRERVIHE